jgi:K+-transporting ATPase A subunit
LPLTTKKQNGHVNPVFAELSGVGFFIALVLMGTQAVLTRRRGSGRTL